MYLILCATVLFTCAKCDLRSKYYENLINQRIAAAEVYEIPQSNTEFKTGIDSTDLIDYGSYDFIIVGSGAAGGVLATRLSEIDHWKILLLEAGDEEDDFNAIPSLNSYLLFSERNWGYYSTPQKTCCLGMKEKKCMIPRGKSIGGSTAINGMIYSRSNHKDSDKWVELGNPGWSYEEVLPYYIKSENSQIHGDHGYHGKGGFWNVEHSRPPIESFVIMTKANLELNVSNVDYNGAKQLGMSRGQINVKHGRRQSTGTAFLDNARRREGTLTLVTKALVTKVNIDKRTKVVQGVTFVKDNVKYTATVRKEVIVSAGAFNSPQLLMLSGIGPKSHLRELGIEVIQDLPVGENLQEHAFLGLIFHTNLTAENIDMESKIKLYLNGYGPLTNPANVNIFGFIHDGDVPESVPMIEYIITSPPGGNSSNISARRYNLNDALVEQYLSKVDSNKDLTVNLVLLHGKSRGRVTLQSNDPTDFPNIDLNLFSEAEDIDNMIKGIEFILKLADTEAFRKINATFVDIPICTESEKYSREFWECVIHQMSMSAFHPHGTTAMGPDNTTSVVDTNLKVHGIENLRVVDAGVIPSTVSCHTASPVVMIAEKISDVIKRDYSYYK